MTTTIKTKTTARPMSIRTIKRLDRQAGHCFFSPSTMRYWGSIIYTPTCTANSGNHTLFVTSETPFDNEPGTRKFTVRRFSHDNRTIFSASEFMEYDSLADATAAMRQIAKQL